MYFRSPFYSTQFLAARVSGTDVGLNVEMRWHFLLAGLSNRTVYGNLIHNTTLTYMELLGYRYNNIIFFGWLLSSPPKATCLQYLPGGSEQLDIMKYDSLNSKEDNDHFSFSTLKQLPHITNWRRGRFNWKLTPLKIRRVKVCFLCAETFILKKTDL